MTSWSGFVLAVLVSLGSVPAAAAPSPVAAPAEVAPGTYVFVQPEGNVLLHIGPRESLVVGALAPAATSVVRQFLVARRAPPVRFAIAADGPNLARYGDGGWGRAGATVVAHERLRARMAAEFRAPGRPASVADAELPTLGFSEVQQIFLSNDEAHAVHQPPGYGDADVSVHLEDAGILYLGSLLTTDGYPDLDLANGGSIDGLIKSVSWFASAFAVELSTRFLPRRGPVTGGVGLREYLDMLVSARNRIQPLVAMGLDDADIVKSGPLRSLDPRWGQGPLSTEAFTALVARSLRQN